jgi:hypothetical protein
MNALTQQSRSILQSIARPAMLERGGEKSATALLLESRIGEHFDSIVTGVSERVPGSGLSAYLSKATWCRGSRAWMSVIGCACN